MGFWRSQATQIKGESKVRPETLEINFWVSIWFGVNFLRWFQFDGQKWVLVIKSEQDGPKHMILASFGLFYGHFGPSCPLLMTKTHFWPTDWIQRKKLTSNHHLLYNMIPRVSGRIFDWPLICPGLRPGRRPKKPKMTFCVSSPIALKKIFPG